MCTLACSIQRLAELEMPGAITRHLQAPGTERREAGGIWWVVFGGWQVACSEADGRQGMVAKIMMLVDIIVWTSSWACPPRHDLTMPDGHGVDNCRLWLCWKGRQFDLGQSRSPTQIFQRNLVSASHRLWAYVWTFSLGLMEMTAMEMAMVIAMVLVMVIVIIVLEVLRQVGSLQHQH